MKGLDLKLLQMMTSDEAIKREVVRQVIYKAADFISVGVKVVGVQEFDNLDVKWSFPSEMEVEYPVAEGASASLSSITWTDFTMTMQKAEGRFLVTDEAQIRGVDKVQYQTGVRRLAEALAKAKDENIIATLKAGAGSSAAASAAWSSATAAQITSDIQAGLDSILSAKGVTDADIKNIALIVPIKAWTPLLKIQEIENIRQSLFDWLTRSYGFTIYPSKSTNLGNDALMLLKGPDTAIHGVLRPTAGIPLVETKRHEGIGVEYIVRQYFATKVVPEESGSTTSKRIYKITGVVS